MNTIMKHLLSTILVLFCILWGLSSCELEHSDNGKLDGFWHLTEVEILATKSHTEKREELVFWAVQGRLMQLMRNGTSIYMRFKHENNTFQVYEPRQNDRMTGDSLITDVSQLEVYGITGLDETFAIETLTRGKLVLRGELLRLYFRKE